MTPNEFESVARAQGYFTAITEFEIEFWKRHAHKTLAVLAREFKVGPSTVRSKLEKLGLYTMRSAKRKPEC